MLFDLLSLSGQLIVNEQQEHGVTRIFIGSLLVLLVVGCDAQRAANTPVDAHEQMEQPARGSERAPTSSSALGVTPSAQVKVFLNPLVMLLVGAEKQAGRPLTRDEVLNIRDKAAFVMMSPDQAQKFYKSLDSQVSVRRMNPDRVWEEWQEIRGQVK